MYRHVLKPYEHDFPEYVECNITGTVPTWLSGCLLRNGCGKYSVGPDVYNHLFDGLAVLHQYKFDNGSVLYRNRLLDSDTKRRNLAANRIVVSELGTVGVPDPCKSIFTRYLSYYFGGEVSDNAAVNLIMMGDQLYAMTETPRIKRLNPETLDTLGEVNTNKLMSLHLNTAHPLQEPDGTTYNLGSSFGMSASYVIFKVPPAAEGDVDPFSKAKVFKKIKPANPKKPSYYHSFAMTENYIVFIEQPLQIHMMKAVKAKLTKSGMSEIMIFDKTVLTRFHLIEKSTGEHVAQKYVADPMFFFHTANAYEEGGSVILDVAAYDNDKALSDTTLENIRKSEGNDEGYVPVPIALLRRYVLPLNPAGREGNLVDIENTSATAKLMPDGSIQTVPEIYQTKIELTRINERFLGRPYRYVYGMNTQSRMEETQLVKFDAVTKTQKTWEDSSYIVTEPVFVPRPDGTEEDDGLILAPIHSITEEKPSGLLIVDAKSFEVVAKAEVPKEVKIPFSFHGIFVS